MIESKMRVLGQKKTRGMEGVKCPTPSLFGVKYDIFFIYCLKMILQLLSYCIKEVIWRWMVT